MQKPAAPAQKPADAGGDQQIGAWLLTCPPPTVQNAACALVQKLNETLSRRVVFVWIFQYDNARNLVSLLRVPTGVLTRPGLVLKTDPKAEGWKVDYASCNATECQAATTVSADQLKALSAAKQTTIAIALDNGQTVNVNLDMDGFANGIAALATRAPASK